MGNQVKMPASEISAKWGRNTKAAIPDAIAGVNRVTDSPTEAAAAKEDKMLAGVTRAVQSGKWAAGLRKVSLQDWKTKTAEKMQQRMAGGVDAAKGKRESFDNYLVETINAVLPQIQAMPDLTLEDSVGRVRAMMEHMANNPYKK